MICFDDNELDIILVTYNRDKFVEEWLEKCGNEIEIRNINLWIYDSSTNDKTKDVVNNRNLCAQKNIGYKYISDELSVGHVVLQAIMESKAKYVWVVGDSRCNDFSDLDKKVFPYIKKGIDHIVLRTIDNEVNDGTIYDDKDLMFRECFISMTCTGFYIYKTAIFDALKNDDAFRENCRKKYDNNYGFTWMGYFLESYAKDDYVTVFTDVKTIDIEPEKKVKRWSARFYKCWCDDLCNIIDGISQVYDADDSISRYTWRVLGFDTANMLYNNRKKELLNPVVYEENKSTLYRVCNDISKVAEFAYADQDELDILLSVWRIKEVDELCSKMKKCLEENIINGMTENVCIYGAGRGGIAIAKMLCENNISIKCFYDINARKLKNVNGIDVRNISDVDIYNDTIIISLTDLYIPIDIFRKSDKYIDPGRVYYPYYM